MPRAKNATLRFIPVTDDGALDLSDLDSLINHQTKLVAMTHMSNVLGTINPVKDIAAKAHAAGARVLIDAAQSVPHMPVDVTDLDCDFLAFSSHKMLGPTGIGGLYVKSDVLEQMEPFLTGGDMVMEVTFEGASWNDLPYRFEAGTPNIAGHHRPRRRRRLPGVPRHGKRHRHETEITQYALEALKPLAEEFTFYGPTDPDQRGGIVSFSSPQIHPHDLGTILDQAGVAIRTGHHCAMPLVRNRLGVAATARASFYVYNTTDEVDVLVATLKDALRYFSKSVALP